MKHLKNLLLIFILVGIVLHPHLMLAGNAQNTKLAAFFEKESVTILVTDSGLGGLSVFADMVEKLNHHKPFREARLIFANALPDRSFRYNALKNSAEKAKVFNNALAGMTRAFQPDLILIACNTLSVVYEQTAFAQSSPIPVLGIVDFGVELIAQKLKDMPLSNVIILGTPTTIEVNSHTNRLIEQGVDAKQLITQPCEMLETEIQTDPGSDMVESMIEMYALESLEKLGSTAANISVALCCTHYGYVSDIFKRVYSESSGKMVSILNPNESMSRAIFPEKRHNRFKKIQLRLEVVSQAEITSEEIKGIGNILRQTSPAAAKALHDYKRNKRLFSF